jgi:L-fuconolactonase
MIRFGITDTHVHLWDIRRLRYPWLDGIPYLNRSFLLPDYNAACGQVKVESMVFMQCECLATQSREEVAWVTDLARGDRRLRGIVAFAPLEKGEGARAEVEELSRNPLVKGIRRIVQSESDPEFCVRPEFVAGVKLLADYGLVFDICISHVQLASAVRLAGKCPGVRMILDHIGKPDIRGGKREPWMTELKEIASLQNVWCKVSSIATEADQERWTPEELRPYVERVFECFGFARTVFAGDWPVSSLAAYYPVAAETLERLLPGASETELRRLFRDNGRELYGVGP